MPESLPEKVPSVLVRLTLEAIDEQQNTTAIHSVVLTGVRITQDRPDLALTHTPIAQLSLKSPEGTRWSVVGTQADGGRDTNTAAHASRTEAARSARALLDDINNLSGQMQRKMAKIEKTLGELLAGVTAPQPTEVQWVATEGGSVGVCIGGQCYVLYKGKSLRFAGRVRPLEKRELGEAPIVADTSNNEAHNWYLPTTLPETGP